MQEESETPYISLYKTPFADVLYKLIYPTVQFVKTLLFWNRPTIQSLVYGALVQFATQLLPFQTLSAKYFGWTQRNGFWQNARLQAAKESKVFFSFQK